MSIYTVNEICWRLVHEPAFRAALERDVATAIADEDLSPIERMALVAGDVVQLYQMGAHGFLLGHLARYRIAGLTVPLYNERMRSIAAPNPPIDGAEQQA
jgi:hypothetical protein